MSAGDSIAEEDRTLVGINTTNPKEELDVKGNVAVDTVKINRSIFLPNNELTFTYWYPGTGPDEEIPDFSPLFGGGGGTPAGVRTLLTIKKPANSGMLFGIGTTDPKAMLHVNGTSYLIGNVAIGNDIDYTKINDYRLTVSGRILAENVVIKAKHDWPDYVFETGYKTKTLNEIEDFIKDNGHLPDMPSAKDANENGIDLGKMDMLLLKKIEELTLLMIEQNRVIQEQSRIIKELQCK
jgi:hypothetical protein